IFILMVLLSPLSSFALEDEEIPASLDFERRAAAVTRWEIPVGGGEFFGDKLEHSFIVGSGLYYHLTPVLAIGADFNYSRINYDPLGDLGQGVTNPNLYLIGGTLQVNLPGAYHSGKTITEVDFYTLLGGAAININDSYHGAGCIGGGMKIYTRWSWFSFKTEVREYLWSVPTRSGSAFEADVTIFLGPSFLIPPYLN
ncbi:MAG: hypothetical protein Q7S98_04120, partial [Deltaproteobacteria bacterium]|nr:hypothetical protein [Deltaproteobacteria bacterium]